MRVVGIEVTLQPEPDAGPEQVTDLIEVLVDALDESGFVPDIRTSGVGSAVHLNVEVLIGEGDPLWALEVGITGITKAFAHAGIEVTTDVHPTMRELEPA